jgi:hypothetical protein
MPCSDAPQYGKAEFRNGASEPEDVLPSTVYPPAAVPTANTLPSATAKPVYEGEDEDMDLDLDMQHTASEGFGLLQKGLFFAVIVGCFVVYLRMGAVKKERYRRDKSLV